jgi:hypothetical protein
MALLGAPVLERMLLVLSCTILLLAILEAAGVTSAVSDYFRHIAFGTYDRDEDNYLRDLDFIGRVRPKVFTAEPSYASLGFIVFSTGWVLTRFSWRKIALVLIGNIAMVSVMASPLFVLSVAALMAIAIAHSKDRSIGYVLVGLTTVFVALASYLLSDAIVSVVIDRLHLGDLETYSSTHVRLIYPIFAFLDVMAVSPILGLGIGGEPNLELFSRVALPYQIALGTNAFFLLLVVLGPLGAGCFIWLLVRHCRRQWFVPPLVTLCLLMFVALQMGGIVTMRFWGYVFLLVGCAVVGERTLPVRRN